MKAKSIFSGDRLHIHHRLLERGLPPRKVALVLYGAAGVAAGMALLSTILNNTYAGLVLLLFCGVTWFGIKNVGYQDLQLASQIASVTTFRKILRSQMILQAAREHLNAADTPTAYWEVVRTMTSELGFCHVWMTLDSVNFFESFDKCDSIPSWTITIPLEGGGHIELAHRFEKPVSTMNLAPLTDLFRSCLRRRTKQNPETQTTQAAEMSPPLQRAARA